MNSIISNQDMLVLLTHLLLNSVEGIFPVTLLNFYLSKMIKYFSSHTVHIIYCFVYLMSLYSESLYNFIGSTHLQILEAINGGHIQRDTYKYTDCCNL